MWSSSTEELTARFRAGKVPDPAGYCAPLRGTPLKLERWEKHWLLVRAIWWCMAVASVVTWGGKRFYLLDGTPTGTNLIGWYGFPIEMMTMALVRETSWLEPDIEVLAVRYDVDSNPRPIRLIRGEVMELEPGLLLGRMVIGKTPLLWYVLEAPAT